MKTIEKLDLKFKTGKIAKAEEVLQLPDKINEIIDSLYYKSPVPFKASITVNPSSFYFGQTVSTVTFTFNLSDYDKYLNLSDININFDGTNYTGTSNRTVTKQNVTTTKSVNATVSTNKSDSLDNKPANLNITGTCTCKNACGWFTSAKDTLTELPENINTFDHTTSIKNVNLTNQNPEYLYIVLPNNVSITLIKMDTNSALSNSSNLEKLDDSLSIEKLGNINFNRSVSYNVYRSGFKLNSGTIYFKIN